VSNVNPSYIVLAVLIAGAIVAFAASRLRRRQVVGLGTVSHQWMAEQRFDQGHHSQR